ncbi:hypothetical protein SLS53_004832 [Cytospora paraplurivora]|uniref:FAD/NAD(P)-binding domain-containing protein n=1 Tax=Cytospora paraplurivora TaxID=2898453 RepID=A0AAN9UE54_9PEZI
MPTESRVENPLVHPFLFGFQIYQYITGLILSPAPPDPTKPLNRPKIAIIGAGITGVSAAAHCVGHGFDVVIFEAGGEENLGGIWSWQRGYPDRQQILSQLRQLWEKYNLDEKTKFNTKIEKVYQDEKGRWVLNDPSNGRFDGLVAAVGTCGAPKRPHIPGVEKFRGPVLHSSELTGKDAKGKKIAVIGGGASAVEALEYAADEEAAKVYILARSDKWIIPRNPIINMLLAFNIFGQETVLSWIPEFLLKKLFYRDLQDVAPYDKGIFTDTPMVNSDVMDKMRSGEAEWVRCDIDQIEEDGIRVNRRVKGVPPGGPGREELIEADMIVLATGFKRPSLSFLPKDSFEEPYGAPNWYLQTFPPHHPSISAINCTYLSAIGTVGNWHIGIYTRILLMFLVDPLTRPNPFWMERWIDFTKVLKARSPTGAFDFFTYLELIWWFAFCVAFNPFRWKWAFFVFFGLGFALPKRLVHAEDKVRNGFGRPLSGQVNRDQGVSL